MTEWVNDINDSNKKRSNGCSGFTLLEVIATIVVIGIISAVVVSRANITDVGQISDIALVKAHLRYAQTRAMTDGSRNWGIVFSGSSYCLFRYADADGDGAFETEEEQAFPGNNSNATVLQSNLSYVGTIVFDWWGAPFTDAGCNESMTSGSISFGGQSVTITRETGFIP